MDQPLLRVQGLKKSYGSLEVLKGIDLALRKGETLSLIGPSGSGKSTCLRCINYLERPTEGVLLSPSIATVGGWNSRPSSCAKRPRCARP